MMHNLNESASSNSSVWVLLHSYLWSCKQIHKIINAPINEVLNRWVHWLAHDGMSKERNMTPQARSRAHADTHIWTRIPCRAAGRTSRQQHRQWQQRLRPAGSALPWEAAGPGRRHYVPEHIGTKSELRREHPSVCGLSRRQDASAALLPLTSMIGKASELGKGMTEE